MDFQIMKKVFFVILFIVTIPALFSQSLVDEPVFSAKRGFYENSFMLEVSYGTTGTTIQYTRDGSDPLISSTALSQPSPAVLTIDPTDLTGRDKAPGVVIRACAIQGSIPLTKTATHTYLFLNKIEELSPSDIKPGDGWPEPNPGVRFYFQGMNYGMDPDVLHDARYQNTIKDALLSIPTISLVTDLKNLFSADSGIYVNTFGEGRAWERKTSVELINPDGSSGFQIDCGLRIRGAWGRMGTNYKHAFRLFFRSEYGAGKLHYPLFGDEGIAEFDNMDLRTAQNYSWAFTNYNDGHQNTEIREVFSRDTQRDMGQPYTRSRYYHLYINGTYWGMYQTQERSEASFGASYLGGYPDDYDVIKVEVMDSQGQLSNYTVEATDGTLDAYQKLWEAASKGFISDELYYNIQGLHPDGSRAPEYPVLIDIDNLIDYMLCSMYVGDTDGPTASGIPNNFYCMYNRIGDRGFVYFRHDAEHSLFQNIDLTLPTTIGTQFRHFNPRWLHQRLSFFPDYRLRFFDHVYKHFFNKGALTVEACSDRVLKRKTQIETAIIAESARWGDADVSVPRTKDDDWLPAVNWILNQYFPTRTDNVLQQLRARGLYPDFEPPVFNLKSGKVTKDTQLTLNATEGTIYYTIDGNDTHQPASLQKSSQTLLVPRNAEKRIYIPMGAVETRWRYSLTYNDSSWQLCNSSPGGIGYDLGSGYDDMISYDIQSSMYTVNSSCLIRIPFEVTQEQINEFDFLILRVQCDDGFIAFLNKSYAVITQNHSGTIQWNSRAVNNHDGKTLQSFDLTSYKSYLLPGKNLLAIQALNTAAADSDFFISAELVAGNSMKSSGPISPSAFVYSNPLTIDHTTKIKARVYKDEQWSALNEIFLWVPQGYDNLIVTEIHYHPLGKDTVDEKEYEFIELKNVGADPLDLSGLAFTEGINYSFPPGTTISSGAHIVLASNAFEFESRYQFAPFGEYVGQLDNGGESILLQTSQGDTIVYLRYNDKYPWPNSSDGLGFSLIRKPDEFYKSANDPTAWCASRDIHGKPGFDDEGPSDTMKKGELPRGYSISQNYPNPFNSATIFEFQIPANGNVVIKVFDILGREVATVLNMFITVGTYRVSWNASNIASGVYFYRMSVKTPSAQVEAFMDTKKLILLR